MGITPGAYHDFTGGVTRSRPGLRSRRGGQASAPCSSQRWRRRRRSDARAMAVGGVWESGDLRRVASACSGGRSRGLALVRAGRAGRRRGQSRGHRGIHGHVGPRACPCGDRRRLRRRSVGRRRRGCQASLSRRFRRGARCGRCVVGFFRRQLERARRRALRASFCRTWRQARTFRQALNHRAQASLCRLTPARAKSSRRRPARLGARRPARPAPCEWRRLSRSLSRLSPRCARGLSRR
jgi:hypothetical protein